MQDLVLFHAYLATIDILDADWPSCPPHTEESLASLVPRNETLKRTVNERMMLFYDVSVEAMSPGFIRNAYELFQAILLSQHPMF